MQSILAIIGGIYRNLIEYFHIKNETLFLDVLLRF